jgi:hypothetical protein
MHRSYPADRVLGYLPEERLGGLSSKDTVDAHSVGLRGDVSNLVLLVNDFGTLCLQTLKTSPHLSNLVG